MFYQPTRSDAAIRQDKTKVAAALLVRNSIPLVENYFAEKKWFSNLPNLLRKRETAVLGQVIAREQRIPLATILEQDDEDVPDQSRLVMKVPGPYTSTRSLTATTT